MTHITLGLLAAFISIAFFRESLVRNDEFMQFAASVVIGLLVSSASFVCVESYRIATGYRDPHVVALENTRVEWYSLGRNDAIEAHERWIKDGMPLRLNGIGYRCERIK